MSAEALSSRRMAAWRRSGTSMVFIDWIRQQWDAFDRTHGVSIKDPAFNMHQEQFTAWLETTATLEQQRGGQQ